jgi:hypothetical protein
LRVKSGTPVIHGLYSREMNGGEDYLHYCLN